MSKRRQLKCYGFFCYPNGLKHDRDKLTTYHGRNYCNKCLQRQKMQVKFRAKLYHYIENEFKIQFPTGRMLAQIKDYVHKRNYTYFGILQSLNYMKHVQDKTLTDFLTLGYVPYVYENARDWWLLNHQRKVKEEKSIQSINNNIEKVQTKDIKAKKKINKIDMNNVLN